MSNKGWSEADIPNLAGKIAIVTGSTSGIGRETARAIAEKGGHVIMAVRNLEKGNSVADVLRSRAPDARIEVRHLDLSDLSSVRKFADGVSADFDQLDVLINNAGIMMCPYSKTADGFEMQMGTNHLGHFALTGLLLPILKATSGSRVVNVASIAHRGGKIDLADLNWDGRKYKTTQAYSDSKIANLYFTFELGRHLQSGGDNPQIIAAHPGWTATELQRHVGLFKLLNYIFAQKPAMGALPTLRAAFDPDAKTGDYYGPSRFMEFNGPPVRVNTIGRAKSEQTAGKLWELSEQMTGVSY